MAIETNDGNGGGSLAGRVAVVTGVSRRAGIGFAIARELLAEGTSVLLAQAFAARRHLVATS
ncbi:hypothetical protein [Streptosporangium sp. H16]|uniref:hypothetical protein n=1 Tax=Streptosporangium sp. H16 TaxID=3444184 RepID=UPI003F79A21C